MANKAGRAQKDRSMLEGEAIIPFRAAIRSDYTREPYERRLAAFLEHIKMSLDTFVQKSKANVKWAEGAIMKYLLYQKERVNRKEIKASTIPGIKKPLKLLLEVNDIEGVNWKKINRMLPAFRSFGHDRAPTVEELRTLTGTTDLRFQAIILVTVSSGIRVGAYETLQWGDVRPITNEDGVLKAASMRVYREEPEEYVTFMTPEAYRKLSEYFKHRAHHGEKITKSSPLFRDRWGSVAYNGGKVSKPQRLQPSGIAHLFEDYCWKYGLRTEKKRRHEFSFHSLRKFFKTRAEQVMKPINVETLMSHSTGISDSYYRPTEKELLDDYVRAIPLLTISEVEEVRRESQLSREELEGRVDHLSALVNQLLAVKVLSQDPSRIVGTDPIGSNP